MKLGKFILSGLILPVLCGCGHSVLLEHEVTGLAVFVPVGSGTLGVVVGNCKNTTATLRGGASVETTTSASGGVFSGAGGVSKITNFKTNAQLNEKNLVKVMTDPNVPDAAKIALATNLAAAAKAPKFMPSIMQTERSTIHLGTEAITSNAVEQIHPNTTGIDKVVEETRKIVNNTVNKTTATTSDIVSDVTATTESVVNNTVDKGTDMITEVTDIFGNLKSILTLIVIIIVIVIIAILIKPKSKKNNTTPTLSECNPDKLTGASKKTKMYTASASRSPLGSAPEEPIDADFTSTEKKVEQSKPSIWNRIVTVFKVIVGLFSRLPPEIKQQLIGFVKDWLESIRNSKKTKPTEQKK